MVTTKSNIQRFEVGARARESFLTIRHDVLQCLRDGEHVIVLFRDLPSEAEILALASTLLVTRRDRSRLMIVTDHSDVFLTSLHWMLTDGLNIFSTEYHAREWISMLEDATNRETSTLLHVFN